MKLFGTSEGTPCGILGLARDAANLQLARDDLQAELREILPDVIGSYSEMVRMQPQDPPHRGAWFLSNLREAAAGKAGLHAALEHRAWWADED